jgi:hypothetical protein
LKIKLTSEDLTTQQIETLLWLDRISSTRGQSVVSAEYSQALEELSDMDLVCPGSEGFYQISDLGKRMAYDINN